MVQWVQLHQRQGRFADLETLSIDTSAAEDSDPDFDQNQMTRLTLWQPLLALSGLLQLCVCQLRGDFDVHQALALLPVTVRYLDLCPSQLQNEQMNLSAFSRLFQLQELTVQLGGVQAPSSWTCIHSIRHNVFKLDAAATFPELIYLTLAPFILSIPAEVEIADKLPNIYEVSAVVTQSHASDVNKLVGAKTLQKLKLYLFDSTERTNLNLLIPADCSLRSLSVYNEMSRRRVTVCVLKKGITCDFTGSYHFEHQHCYM